MMEDKEPCVICQLEDQRTDYGSTQTAYLTRCTRCGDFEWEQSASTAGRSKRQVRMSGFVREQNAAGIVPVFTHDLVRIVERLPIPSLRKRSARLLTAIVRSLGYDTNGLFGFDDRLDLLAVSYSANPDDLDLLLQILGDDGLLEYKGRCTARLTTAGCLAAEELTQPHSISVQGFVAMWFDSSMNDAYTLGFDQGIRSAGYSPLRIDNKEHAGPISDAILTEIRRSRFVVADYTGTNNGVYFEAGFAMGLGIPVTPTCRADWLDKLHFDIRHINTLKWETPEDLAVNLAKRLSAVLGDGPLVRPGSSQA